MTHLIKFILISIIAFETLLAATKPKVYLSIEPQEIYSGEELNVSINIESLKRVNIEFPEIDKIAKLPIIAIKDLKRNIIKEINGTQVAVAKISRVYTIMPTKSIIVGPLSVKIDGKVYKSKKKKVHVVNSSAKGNNFVFRMSTNKSEVVVGEPFIVKIELVEPTALSSANIEYLAPRFENFTVTPLGSGETVQRGSNLIRTIRYLLKAKEAGKFMLEPATAKIEIQATPLVQSPFAFFGDEAQIKTITTNSVSIVVKPLPQKVDIVGDFKIKAEVDKKRRSANKPIEYRVTISGEGSLSDLKDIHLTIPDVTIYPHEPKIENIATKEGVESRYQRKFILIAKKDFTIPPITLKEFNINKRVVEELKTKAIKIDIKSIKSISSLLSKKKEEPLTVSQDRSAIASEYGVQSQESKERSIKSQKESEVAKIEEILIDKNYYKRKYAKEGYSLAMLLFAALIGLLLGFVAAWNLPKILAKKEAKAKEEQLYEDFEDALNILYPHTTSDPKIEEMVKTLYEVVNGNHALTIDKKRLDKMIKKIKRKEKRKQKS